MPTPNTTPTPSTMLDLVWRLTDSTPSSRETVEQALHLLRSGRVRLTGTFRTADWSAARATAR